jgi:hypothetical protein
MEYSMDAVANKMILVIAALSALIAVGGYVAFVSMAGNADARIVSAFMGVNLGRAEASDAIPFAAGVVAAMGLNIAKVILMKRAVSNAVKREAVAAKLYLQGQYFLRLVLTVVVFVAVGFVHNMPNDAGNPQYINFMGTAFGIFTFPVATYSMRFFLRYELKDGNPELLERGDDSAGSTVQDAIKELNAIGNDDDCSDYNI